LLVITGYKDSDAPPSIPEMEDVFASMADVPTVRQYFDLFMKHAMGIHFPSENTTCW